MPVFDDMMAAARGDEALEGAPSQTPVLVARRCVRALHQASGCMKCAEACPERALSVKLRSVAVDAAACTGCGACAAHCPAEALYMRSPGAARKQAFLALARQAGTLSIACGEAAGDARRMADMTTACLGTLDMSLPAAMAADRAKDAFTLHVVHGDCARCARRGGCANPVKAIEAWRATLSQLAPRAALEIHAAPKSVDTGRRRFWGRLLQKAELGLEADEPFDEASLAWLESVPLRTVPPGRGRWLEALKKVRADEPEALSAMMAAPGRPRFAAPRIDHEACTACGLCAAVCPSGALAEEKSADLTLMKATPSKCIACGLCADICFRHAVTILPLRHPEAALDENPVVVFARRAEAPDAVWEEKLRTMIKAPVYRT